MYIYNFLRIHGNTMGNQKVNIFLFCLLVGFSINAMQEDAMLFKQIYTEHCKKLKNTDIQKKPFFICFSGTPGMGKSTLANKLEDHYKAVKIRTDDVRAIINSLDLQDKKSALSKIQDYLQFFFKEYQCPNKFIIIDASIDRTYTLLFPMLEKNKIPYLVIRLEVDPDTVLKRIQEREKDVKFYLSWMPDARKDYENFLVHNKNKNIIMFDNNNSKPDLKKIYKAVDAYL